MNLLPSSWQALVMNKRSGHRLKSLKSRASNSSNLATYVVLSSKLSKKMCFLWFRETDCLLIRTDVPAFNGKGIY